jgi:hypothetical protein
MYVKTTNGAVDQYPYTVGNLRRDNPNTSFPKRPTDETLASWDVYPVAVASRPSYNEKTQNIEAEAQPSLVDGVWTLGWVVTDKTTEEITEYNDGIANINRQSRDRLLEETDWWAVSDRIMTPEQTAYRQALRDITTHANWPHLEESDWPTKP